VGERARVEQVDVDGNFLCLEVIPARDALLEHVRKVFGRDDPVEALFDAAGRS